ncbi:hypothetical protein C8R41DRAFT_869943 [Lentinula lateritia]|uniref:Uncharacterized protein n=1 Tax=Lentinula lateritia TaxID=40482 RepID=A0ABQ8V574_9AGAR|nr:hypothetical protein C8R41DRAFT_869943 [Lentinula lateritia]
MDDAQLHHLHAALQNDNTYLGSPANCPPGQGRWEDDGQKGLKFAHPKPPAIEHPVSIVMCVVGKVSNINICMGPLGAHRVKKPDFKLSKTRKTIVLNCPAKTPFSRDWSTAEAKLNRTVALQTTEKPAFLVSELYLDASDFALQIRDSTMPVDGRIMAAVPKNEKDDDDWKEIARNYTLAFVPVFDHHGNPIPQNNIQFSLLNATVLAKFTLHIYKWAGCRVNVTADIVSLSILYTSQALPRAVGVAPVDYTRLPQTPSRDLITHPELTPPNSVDGGQPYYHRDSSHTRTAAVRTPPSANVGRRNPYPTPLSSPFMLAHPPAAPSVYSHPQLRSPATTNMQHNLAMTPISRAPTPQMHVRNSYSDACPSTGSTVAEVQNHPYPYWPRIENGAHSQNDFAAFRLTQYAPPTAMNTVWPDYESPHLTLSHDDIYHTPHVTQSPLTSPARVLASGVGGTFRGHSASTGPVTIPNGVTQRAATAPIPDLHSTPTKGSCEPEKHHPLQRAMQSGDDNTTFSGSPPSNRDIGLSIQNKEPKFTFDQALPVVGLDTQNVRNNSHIAYKNTGRWMATQGLYTVVLIASIPFELLLRIAFFTAGDKGAAHSMPLVSRGFYAATIENLYSTVNGNALTTLAQDQPTFTTYKLPAACVRELLIEGVPLAFETDTDNTFPGFISVFLSAPCSTGEELHWYNIINNLCTVNTTQFELNFSGINGSVTFEMLAIIMRLLHGNSPHLRSLKLNLAAPHLEGEHDLLQEVFNDNTVTFTALQEFSLQDAPLYIENFLRRHSTVTTLTLMPAWQVYNDTNALHCADVVPHLKSFTGTGNLVAAACDSH